MTTDRNVSIELHMSSAQLGWLTVRPIVSDAEQRRHFKVLSNQDEPSAMLLPIGDGAAPASNNGLAGRGVRTAKLTGVDLLRREHVAGGHLSLKRVMLKLKLTRSESSYTHDDVKTFLREGCGGCESFKMKRRPFTLATAPSNNVKVLGKTWIFDTLALRTASKQHGYLHIGLFVDSVSKVYHPVGMHGLTEHDVELAIGKLRAFVRPKHGEVDVIRMDSHPSHRALALTDFMASSGIHRQLSPPYVHEGVGLCENAFYLMVPSALALLHGAMDLDEQHFFVAFLTACCAYNHAYTISSQAGKSSSPTSPQMLSLIHI